MALEFAATSEAIKRTSGIVAASSDYSCTFWLKLGPAVPATYRTYFIQGDDLSVAYLEYVRITSDPATPGQNIMIEARDVSTTASAAFALTPGVWTPIGYVRSGTTHRLYAGGSLLASITEDVSAATFVEQWMGDDDSGQDHDHQVTQFKEWDVALSLEDLRREWANSPAIQTTDIWAETPLLTDLLDDSGSGRDWVLEGTPDFVSEADIPLEEAPGWSFIGVSVVNQGSTSLLIAKPTGTLDGHWMYMALSHKGAGFATVPAGWTVIGQGLSGVTRGELLRKRASNEGANYSITGLATAASGVIVSYDGGPLSGNPVEVFAVTSNASGVELIDSITTTTKNAMILAMAAAGANNSATNFGNGGGFFEDQDLWRIGARANGGAPGGVRVAISDALKVVPGVTDDFSWSMANVENVGIMAAVIPQATHQAFDTRYYLTTRAQNVRVDGLPQGSWNATHNGPTVRGRGTDWVFRLERSKAGSGALSAHTDASNQQANWDMLWGRWMSPPMEAQPVSGTVDLLWFVEQHWEDDTTGVTDSSDCRTRLHIYITKGQTAEVRSILLNRYVDATKFPFATGAIRALAAAQALVAGEMEDGDCIMVELGVRVVSSPTPAPKWPPDEWTNIDVVLGGTTNTSNPTSHSGVPYADAVVGVSGGSQAPYLQFSHRFQKQSDADALPAAPTNLTAATAALISTLPHEGVHQDTTRAPSNNREVWDKWVADEDRIMLAGVMGSNHNAEIDVFTGDDPLALTSGSYVTPILQSLIFMAPSRGLHVYWFTAVKGETYWIRRRSMPSTFANAASSGGADRLILSSRRAPAIDDIYAAGQHLGVYDQCGHAVNMTSALSSSAPTAALIDYSKVSMDDLNGGTHELERLYLALHGVPLVEVLDLATLNIGQSEIDFIGDVWNGFGAGDPPTIEKPSALAFDDDGNIVVGSFGNGYLFISGGLPLPAFLMAESNPATRAAVRRVDKTHADLQAGAPWPFAESFQPAVEITSVHSFALSEDGDTLYYTSGGWYFPKAQRAGVTQDLRAEVVKRFSLSTNKQLDDFATVPLVVSANAGLRGLCIVPDDHGILVCNGNEVNWLDRTGDPVRRYLPPGGVDLSLTSVQLTHDARHLWAWDDSEATLIMWDLLTGAFCRRVETWQAQGLGTQLALYQPNGINRCW